MTISGTDFTGATAVKFGSTDATGFKVDSESAITAVAPAGAGTVDVTVTTPEGVSPLGSADLFTYSALPAVSKASPAKGPATGGTAVTITGADLTGATAVNFGSTAAASFKVNSATSISAVSPANSAGIVDLTVTTPGGTSTISSADRFKFVPSVTGVSPNAGAEAGGTGVTISGTGFAPGKTATAVKFGKTQSTSINCISTTECTAVSPPHAIGAVDVKVTVDKTSSAKNVPADQFTYE